MLLFSHCEIIKNAISQCENNKHLQRNVINYIQCPRFERNKNQRKCKKQKIQWFWRWIWNLFHSWDRIRIHKKIKKNTINNSIFNVKPLNILYVLHKVLFSERGYNKWKRRHVFVDTYEQWARKAALNPHNTIVINEM